MRGRLLFFLILGLVAGAILGVTLLNRRLTAFVESEAFRRELDKQTSKGLHFQGHYDTIRRTGLLTVRTDGFTGKEGVKAIKTISTGEVDAKFNPSGIFLRRWQLDYIRIPAGKAEIQTYEPKPDNKPPKPWYSILPDHVYLKEVVCDATDVTWQLRGREAGFFQTRLLITPYGRDFEYRASGGVMKTGMVPDLTLRQTHLVITKELLTLHELELAPSPKSDGRIRVKGQAGMRDDKRVSAEMKFSGVPVDPWVPKAWASLFQGVASGDVMWQGGDMTMETSSGQGAFRIEGGRVAGAPFLDEAAAVTGRKSMEEIKLSRCSLEFAWKYPRAEVKQIDIEAEGVFRLQGAVVIENKRLGGTLQFGATPKYLEWLPKAERVFARQRDGYLWTTVNLAGTLDEPKEDLSPRVAELLKKSPGAAIGIFIRRVGEWFGKALGEK